MVDDKILGKKTFGKKTSERYDESFKKGPRSTVQSAMGLSKKSKKKKTLLTSTRSVSSDTTLAQVFGLPPKKKLPTKKDILFPKKQVLSQKTAPTTPKPLSQQLSPQKIQTPAPQKQQLPPLSSPPLSSSSFQTQEKQQPPFPQRPNPFQKVQLSSHSSSLPEERPFSSLRDQQELRPEAMRDYENPLSSHLQNVIDQTRYSDRFLKTHVPGLDALLVDGIPKGASVIICGGTGSGKTILNLQIMAMACRTGKRCLYLTLEESEARLIDHMMDFGWDAKRYIKEGKLRFLRLNPFDIMRSVDALLAKEKGELLIDIKPVILPKDFVPEMIFVDSLTAISAAFIGRRDTYRIYIEKLFRYFEELKATTFLITETEQIPTQYSPTGTEEFLADGVIILYSIQRHNVRERAIEVLKMRGLAHQQKIVSMRIIKGIGIKIFPEKEVPITI